MATFVDVSSFHWAITSFYDLIVTADSSQVYSYPVFCFGRKRPADVYFISLILTANSPSKSTLAPTRGTPAIVATAQLTFKANPTKWISTRAANTQMLPTLAPTQMKTVLAAQSTPSTVLTTQLTATATSGIQSTATPGFRVTVVTSDGFGAGTDALLYIALIGTDGKRSGLTEIVSEQEDFERGR